MIIYCFHFSHQIHCLQQVCISLTNVTFEGSLEKECLYAHVVNVLENQLISLAECLFTQISTSATQIQHRSSSRENNHYNIINIIPTANGFHYN